ncbi:MAG: twin-arginine translocase subunit TatB [Deltaproteobacteria bacterium]|nr:twin-arginine translocase subunit TatB [Deltaproteobacteria bacterium]
MFGISFAELVVIFMVALLLFGPHKLPEIARTLGEAFAQLRKSTEHIREEFQRELAAPTEEFRKIADEAINSSLHHDSKTHAGNQGQDGQ